MNEFQIKIDKLSGNGLEVVASLANLNISFENNALLVDLKIDKKSNDQRIGEIHDRLQLRANNGKKIKVVHPDGSPSMILARDAQGKIIQRVITPPQPIYEAMKDEEGKPIVDDSGKAIMELIGHSLPELEDVYVQETIGEFEFWKKRYQALVNELLKAIVRKFEGGEEVVYVREEDRSLEKIA